MVENPISQDLSWKLVLPDLSKVLIQDNCIFHNEKPISQFTQLERTESLAISAIGTPYETSNPAPRNPVIQIEPPSYDQETKRLPIEEIWITLYVLFTLYKDQETIPVLLHELENREEITSYILYSGLGRRHPRPNPSNKTDVMIFLSRAAFWQGAGNSYHSLGWLRSYATTTSSFPTLHSFTRSQTVITSHPLRPPKPHPGALREILAGDSPALCRGM